CDITLRKAIPYLSKVTMQADGQSGLMIAVADFLPTTCTPPPINPESTSMELPSHLLPPADGKTYSGLWDGGPMPRGANGDIFTPRSPIDGEPTCQIRAASPEQVSLAATMAEITFREWRQVPAPRRGEFVRVI